MIRGAAAVATVAVVASGCAFIARNQVDRFSRRVAVYERAAPDAESLGRGDVEVTSNTVREMGQWADHIGRQDLPPVDRQRLVDRLAVARRRYLLAAARLANTPDLGYAIARTTIADDDPEALAAVRELSLARAKRRQDLFATSHTYEIDLGDDPVWKTTSSGAAFVDGQLVAASTHAELVERTGNCVYATRPFGKDGTANPSLTFHLVGDRAFYLRCYVRRDPTGLPRADGAWVVGKTAGGYDVKGLTPKGSPSRVRDFLITPTSEPNAAAANLVFSLSYDYSDGLIVVWEDGASRLRKRMRSIELAGSPVFWEHAPGETAAADGPRRRR